MVIDGNPKLSNDFWLSEFSCPAVINGEVRNDLDRHVLFDMKLINLIQKVRDFYERPILSITGYRSIEYNSLIPGADPNSYHIRGKAVDFHIYGVPMIDLYNKCIKLGFTGVGIYDTWIHADVGDTIRRWDNRTHTSKYEKIGLTHITWVEPLELKAKASFTRTGKQCSSEYSNFINGQYYWWKPADDKIYTIGWQFSEGQPTHDNFMQDDYEYVGLYPRKRGTFIVYKDGTAEVKNMANSEMKKIRDSIRFCVQGFNLFPLDLQAEGYTNISSLTRICNRVAIMFHKEKGVGIVYRPFTSAKRMQQTAINLGCEFGIVLDSGRTANVKMNGKRIHVNNELLSNIIYWRF